MLSSNENTIIIAWAKLFQINVLVYSHGLPKGLCGIILNVIIRTFDIRILWGRTVVSMGRIKG